MISMIAVFLVDLVDRPQLDAAAAGLVDLLHLLRVVDDLRAGRKIGCRHQARSG